MARGIAELQTRESAVAREAAFQAASVAEIANTEALRLALEADAAREVLAAAELAVQQEAESEPTEEAFRAYSLNFNQQDDGAFETVVGISERVAGQLHLLPGEDGVAVSVLDNEALPERTATRVYTTVRADAYRIWTKTALSFLTINRPTTSNMPVPGLVRIVGRSAKWSTANSSM